MKSKEAQMGIESLGAIAVSIVVAAVILGLGGTILEKIQTGQTDNTATTANNESLTWAGNNTAIGLRESRIISGSEKVWNQTTLLVTGTHYDLGSSAITFVNDTSPGFDLDTNKLNISYDYNYGSEAYNSSNSGMSGTTTLAQFIPTIAIVAVAAIVIGIILVFFGRRRLMA